MYCPKCGKENPDNAQFCQWCGRSFNPVQRTGQAQAPGQQQPGNQGQVARIPNYLVWAIICIFLCWPTAIPAIVYASRVDGQVASGDIDGARTSSEKAKSWAVASTAIAAFLFILAIILGAVA